MAEKTPMTDDAMRIAESIHGFAAREGWPRDDYRIQITINTDWYTIHVLVRSKKINEGEVRMVTGSILDTLERDLKDNPDLYIATGLVAVPFRHPGLEEGRLTGPNFVEIDEQLLNSGGLVPVVPSISH